MSDDEQITLPKALLQAVFDIATGSMDFGSGFLCDDEVEHLRALAVAIGVDPMLGTQATHRCKYRGGHNWSPWFDSGWGPQTRVKIRTCRDFNARDDWTAEKEST